MPARMAVLIVGDHIAPRPAAKAAFQRSTTPRIDAVSSEKKWRMGHYQSRQKSSEFSLEKQ
jgi:hypothetical protein